MMTHNKIGNQLLEMEIVMLEQLVKLNLLLRTIDKFIDFNFIYNLVEPFCVNATVISFIRMDSEDF